MSLQTHHASLSIATAALALTISTAASAQTIIQPVSATESSHDTAFGSSITAAIDGSGLSDATIVETGDSPATGFASNPHDTDALNNMWRTFISANGSP